MSNIPQEVRKSKEFNMELVKEVAKFRNDPLNFVRFAFPWGEGELENAQILDWQKELLEYIGNELQQAEKENRGAVVRCAVRSGHGIGKSALVGFISNWSISTEADCRGVITANTEKQLKTKTWSELANWYNMSICKQWFDFNATSICSNEKGHEKTWKIDQVTWSLNNTEAFAGLHNKGKRILLIFDEASAIPNLIWEVAEGALTDKDTQIIWLCFGNPTRKSGRFFECFNKFSHRWKTFRVDSRTVPITNKEQIEEWENDYGNDSDFFRIRVTGEFPRAGINQFISSELVDTARGKHFSESEYRHAPKVMGVDVARFGSDETVFYFRQGLQSFSMKTFRGLDTQTIGELINQEAKEFKADAVFIDAVGIGAGVVDKVRSLGVQGVYECNGGSQALKNKEFVNRNAEMWHKVKEWLKAGGSIPDDSQLCDQLTNREYGYDRSSRLQLEKKEDMKNRGLSSPDRADALALTFYADVASNYMQRAGVQKVARTEYDIWSM